MLTGPHLPGVPSEVGSTQTRNWGSHCTVLWSREARESPRTGLAMRLLGEGPSFPGDREQRSHLRLAGSPSASWRPGGAGTWVPEVQAHQADGVSGVPAPVTFGILWLGNRFLQAPGGCHRPPGYFFPARFCRVFGGRSSLCVAFCAPAVRLACRPRPGRLWGENSGPREGERPRPLCSRGAQVAEDLSEGPGSGLDLELPHAVRQSVPPASGGCR